MSQETYEQTFSVDKPARLIVKNIRGSVTITPGDAKNISIKAVKHLNSGSQEDTRVELSQKPDGVVKAVVDYDTYGFFKVNRPCKVDFEITAPEETAIRLKTVSAQAYIQGFQGDFELKTVSGRLEIQDLTGDIFAKTVSGKILASDLSGPAEIDTVSGGIRINSSQFPTLKASSVSGSILAHTPLAEGPYTFSTVSGSIKLITPQDSACHINASSVSGSFKTDLDAKNLSSSRRHWQVQIGEGGPDIKMKTVSGSMRLLSSEDAVASSPRVKKQTTEERISILSKLENGEISVEETLTELKI